MCTFDTGHKVIPYAPVKKSSLGRSFDLGAYRPNVYPKSELCGWMQPTNDDFDFIRSQGKTPSKYTGPSNDHTTGSGHYMFIEASRPRKPRDAAILRTPKMASSTYCIRFYAHVFGVSLSYIKFLKTRCLYDILSLGNGWAAYGTIIRE